MRALMVDIQCKQSLRLNSLGTMLRTIKQVPGFFLLQHNLQGNYDGEDQMQVL